MAELANCSRCGKLIVKDIRDVCRECYKEEEQKFQMVYEFLKQQKNRESTILEVVEATGVEEELIIKFIKQNRLRSSMFPKLAYPCERCGTDITQGKICADCGNELQNELTQLEKVEEISKRNKEEKEKINIYYTLDKHRR